MAGMAGMAPFSGLGEVGGGFGVVFLKGWRIVCGGRSSSWGVWGLFFEEFFEGAAGCLAGAINPVVGG